MDEVELKIFIYISSSCSSNPFSSYTFTTEEITSSTNEAAKGANKTSRNLPSCFFVLFYCFSNSIN